VHLTADDYYTMTDVTRLITRLYGSDFVYSGTKEFVSQLVRLATRRDPVFPLVDFIARSADRIAAMENKRYDNALYRRERELAGAHVHCPPLERIVSCLVDFMAESRLVPALSLAK
jgi:hypothetical protein